MTQALNSSRTAQGTSGADATPGIPGPDTSDPFDRLLAQVAPQRGEFEEKRQVPHDMIAEFKKAGIYRAGAPARFGGDALPPAEFLQIVERISQVDGSAGWVASFGSSLIYLAALPLDTQAELYADGPDVAFAEAEQPDRLSAPLAELLARGDEITVLRRTTAAPSRSATARAPRSSPCSPTRMPSSARPH